MSPPSRGTPPGPLVGSPVGYGAAVSSTASTVARLGITPLKGGAHGHPRSLDVTVAGPVGDRRFALLTDHPLRGTTVVRTVENPSVLRITPTLDADGTLHLELPEGEAFSVAPTTPTGAPVAAEYWRRPAVLHPIPGPWDEALSRLVGYPVGLARADQPGGVVYAEPVTLVSTSSLHELARRGGVGKVDSERFRATVLVDTGPAAPFVEDGWVGRRLRAGQVELEVRSSIARCAVTRLVPGTGERAGDDPLRLLAADRTRGGEIVFGVGAVVLAPGTLRVGDPVTVA